MREKMMMTQRRRTRRTCEPEVSHYRLNSYCVIKSALPLVAAGRGMQLYFQCSFGGIATLSVH